MVMAPGREESRPAPPRVLRLKHTRPERIPVEIERSEGVATFWAYVCRHQRYPVDIAGELEDARDDYAAKRERIWEDEPPPDLLEVARDIVTSAEAGDDLAKLTEQIGALKEALRTYDETPRYRDRSADWEAFITRVLCILIPGLEEDTARMMPRATRMGWLWELGYFDQREQGGEEQADNPPEKGASSTGAEPAPDSPATTA